MSSAERIPLNGIKVSPDLLLLRLPAGDGGVTAGPALVRLLAERQINMPFVSLDSSSDGAVSMLAVEMSRAEAVTGLLQRHNLPGPPAELVPHAVMVSLYPHATRLGLLGRLLHLAGREAISVYGMASSIAALAFLIPHEQLERALSMLEEAFALPANRSPYRAEFTVEQSTLMRPSGGRR